MRLRAPDPRFPSLTLHCLFFYWIVCHVTLGITIGSVVRQVGVYEKNCDRGISSYTYEGDISYSIRRCVPGDIVVFALGLVVAVVAIVQATIQLLSFYHHNLSPLRLAILNAVVMVLWIVVLAIGWNPTGYTYDEDTGTSVPNISGWLYTYAGYWVDESYRKGISPTLALAMGFSVMSLISFGLVTLLALYAFIIYHQAWKRQCLADNEALAPATTTTTTTTPTPAPPPKMTEKTTVASNPSPTHQTLVSDQVAKTFASTEIPKGVLARSRSM